MDGLVTHKSTLMRGASSPKIFDIQCLFVFLEKILFLSFWFSFYITYTCKKFRKNFFGLILLVLIQFKWFQNMSECSTTPFYWIPPFWHCSFWNFAHPQVDCDLETSRKRDVLTILTPSQNPHSWRRINRERGILTIVTPSQNPHSWTRVDILGSNSLSG